MMLRTKGRMKQRSDKAVAKDMLREACRRVVLVRDGYKCRVNVPSVCGTLMPGWLDVHEILSRAAGGDITDPDNCVTTCRACHGHIHHNANWARDMGWTLSPYEGRRN